MTVNHTELLLWCEIKSSILTINYKRFIRSEIKPTILKFNTKPIADVKTYKTDNIFIRSESNSSIWCSLWIGIKPAILK